MAASKWDDSISDEDLDEEPPITDKAKRFLWAARKGRLDVIEGLYFEDNAILHSKDEHDYCALHFAASEGHYEVIEFLIPLFTDLNLRTSDGWTPLHCACKWNRVKIAELLIQNDANINAVSDGNVTPLHNAASSKGAGKLLVLLLSNHKIQPNLCNNAGDTAFDIARRTDSYSPIFGMVADCINNF